MNKKLSEHFHLSEFNDVEPEPMLLAFLEWIRLKGKTVIILNSARTVLQHIAIYKKIHGEKWLSEIKWKSRHLAKFGCALRAVDFCVKKKDDKLMSGDEIKDAAKEWSINNNLPLGCGAGQRFAHIDVDRKQWAEWAYDY